MPVTRLDMYKKEASTATCTHHRAEPPKTYDEPSLWLPKEADTAGGQVWVPKGSWACWADTCCTCRTAVAAARHFARRRSLPPAPSISVSSSSWRASTLQPEGWALLPSSVSTAGRPPPRKTAVCKRPLHGQAIDDSNRIRRAGRSSTDFRTAGRSEKRRRPSRFKVGQCNYRWSAEYGSKNWSVADPKKEGSIPYRYSRRH